MIVAKLYISITPVKLKKHRVEEEEEIDESDWHSEQI
jgi:hypothetical protein